MKIERSTLWSLGCVVLSFALVAAVYNRLPDLMPTHWSANGIVNGRIAKPWGPFIMPLFMAGILALLLALPRLSPKRYDIAPFRRAFGAIQFSIVGFLFAVNVMVVLYGLGWAVPMSRFVWLAAGVLFVALGNYMGKLTPNYFVGIRTPWTLADPEVWFRTHRFGGKAIMLAGVASAVFGLVGASRFYPISAIVLGALVPAIYSYLVYRRLEHARRDVGRAS